MGITATEIREVGFEHSLRGYDVEQVDDFLEKVAVAVDEMNQQLDQLKAQQKKQADTDKTVVTNVTDGGDELERATERAHLAEDKLAEFQNRLREADKRAREAQSAIETLKKELEERKERDNIISEAFISAQRSAEDLKENARAEGERIYRESETKARELIREALSEKQRIFTQIDTLEASCAKFRKDYKKMIERFSTEADRQFKDLHAPVIPDSIVNELMPTSESVDAKLAAVQTSEQHKKGKSITDSQIPLVAPVKSETRHKAVEVENPSGSGTADAGMDIEEID